MLLYVNDESVKCKKKFCVNKLMYIEISLTSNKMAVTFIVCVFRFYKNDRLSASVSPSTLFPLNFILMDFKDKKPCFFISIDQMNRGVC